MPDNNHLLPPTSKRPFATTADRYNDEQASGNVKGSNFPYHEVRSLPGYSERDRPGLTAADVTNELARYLAEYAKQKASLLPYQQRDMSHYLWLQASRRMLAWEEILSVVRVGQEERFAASQSATISATADILGKERNHKGEKTHQAGPVHLTGRRVCRMPDRIPV